MIRLTPGFEEQSPVGPERSIPGRQHPAVSGPPPASMVRASTDPSGHADQLSTRPRPGSGRRNPLSSVLRLDDRSGSVRGGLIRTRRRNTSDIERFVRPNIGMGSISRPGTRRCSSFEQLEAVSVKSSPSCRIARDIPGTARARGRPGRQAGRRSKPPDARARGFLDDASAMNETMRGSRRPLWR